MAGTGPGVAKVLMQRFIHWLEEGRGAAFLKASAWCALLLLLVLVTIYKRFGGPPGEDVLAQAAAGREVARGHGWSTPVLSPEAVAWMEERHAGFRADRDVLPELYHPPLYPGVIGLSLKMLPARAQSALFSRPAEAASAYRADYFLLAVNMVFFGLTAVALFYLAGRIFSKRAAWVALTAWFLSAAIWGEAMRVSGTLILTFFILLLFILVHHLERIASSTRQREYNPFGAMGSDWKGWGVAGACGAVTGTLFLGSYTAGALSLVALCAYFGIRFSPRGAVRGAGCLLLVFLVVTGPWMARNISLTGFPTGLAYQEFFRPLQGDAADHLTHHAEAYTTERPDWSLRGWVGRGLAGASGHFQGAFWQAGGWLFAACFVVSAFYRFRNIPAGRLRWLALACVALFLLGGPFFSAKAGAPGFAVLTAPLILLFGTGFLLMLTGGLAGQERWKERALLAAVLLLHALPLGSQLWETRRLPFEYPPYFPRFLAELGPGLEQHFYPGFVLMSDIPAGAAWYGGIRVWGQPATYHQFLRIDRNYDIGALLLSPRRLDRLQYTDYATQIVRRQPIAERAWEDVYIRLWRGEFPPEFPFTERQAVTENMILLVNPLSGPPMRQGGR